MKEKKISILVFAVLAIVPLIIIFSMLYYESSHVLKLFPSEKFNSIGWWYFGDNSDIDSFEFNSRKIELEYTLKSEPSYSSYAGFSIFLDKDFPFLDLSAYKNIRIKLSTQKTKKFGLLIQTFEKGITLYEKDAYDKFRYSQVESNILEGQEAYSFALKDFKVPDWWISLYAPKGKSLDSAPFKHSAIFQVFFNDPSYAGEKSRVEVSEIVFDSRLGGAWTYIIAGIIAYYLIFGVLLFCLINRKAVVENRSELLSSYQRIESHDRRQQDGEILTDYITKNYCQPDISPRQISELTGISTRRIGEIIQKKYAMNFKECITWLRLEEAKRLLIETDLNITEIAYKLGFNSNSYFGLVFKNHQGVSPKEFRENRNL